MVSTGSKSSLWQKPCCQCSVMSGSMLLSCTSPRSLRCSSITENFMLLRVVKMESPSLRPRSLHSIIESSLSIRLYASSVSKIKTGDFRYHGSQRVDVCHIHQILRHHQVDSHYCKHHRWNIILTLSIHLQSQVSNLQTQSPRSS